MTLIEQRHVDFSFDFEAETQALISHGAIRYLRDPVGFVRDVRKSVGNAERFRAMFDQWDAEARAFVAYLETLDASEIRDWEENLQQ